MPALPPSTLWIVGRSGGEPRRLTQPGQPTGGHGEPSWSPDGRRIAFSASDRRSTAIWSVGVDGDDLQPIAAEARINLHPTFGFAGQDLLFVGPPADGRQASAYVVWRQPLDDRSGKPLGEPHPVVRPGLATIRQLAISPDGRELVYGALKTASDLWGLPLAGNSASGPPQPLTSGLHRVSRPAFSPDGARLVYDRWQVGTNLDLRLRDLTTGEDRALTHATEWDSQGTFFADGQRLAYFSERQGRRGVWAIDTETGEHEFLADLGPEPDWARLSPDGREIAFHSRQDGTTLQVYVHELASGESRRLTDDPELAGWPVWAPDGEWLAVEIRRGRDTHIAVLPAGGGELRQLTDDPGESWPYSWTADGSSVVYAALRDEGWELRRVEIDGGTDHLLLAADPGSRDGYLRYPAWSPRDDLLVYERSRTVGDLWQVDLSVSSHLPGDESG